MLLQVVVKLVEELKDKYTVHLICSCLSDTEKYFKAISGYDTCGDGGIDVKSRCGISLKSPGFRHFSALGGFG